MHRGKLRSYQLVAAIRGRFTQYVTLIAIVQMASPFQPYVYFTLPEFLPAGECERVQVLQDGQKRPQGRPPAQHRADAQVCTHRQQQHASTKCINAHLPLLL